MSRLLANTSTRHLEHAESLLGGQGTSLSGLLNLQHIESHSLRQRTAHTAKRHSSHHPPCEYTDTGVNDAQSGAICASCRALRHATKQTTATNERQYPAEHNTATVWPHSRAVTHRHCPTVTTSPSFTRNAGEQCADSVLCRFSKLQTQEHTSAPQLHTIVAVQRRHPDSGRDSTLLRTQISAYRRYFRTNRR